MLTKTNEFRIVKLQDFDDVYRVQQKFIRTHGWFFKTTTEEWISAWQGGGNIDNYEEACGVLQSLSRREMKADNKAKGLWDVQTEECR